MTDNETIARWAGTVRTMGYGPAPDYPDYTKDSAAITLLPVLVKRGYLPTLRCLDQWLFRVVKPMKYDKVSVGATIAQAITQAVLNLIESEAKNDLNRTEI